MALGRAILKSHLSFIREHGSLDIKMQESDRGLIRAIPGPHPFGAR